MNKQLHALYGLKWNPFAADIPTEALLVSPLMENFCWRIENTHVRDGGFAMITGDPGCGKSCLLRLLSDRLGRMKDITVGTFAHPQSSVSDFYRELGDLFDVPIKPGNRYYSFKSLRIRWQQHIENSHLKPVLIVDEAQEMPTTVLNELRLLNSHQFDSRNLLSVIFAGNDALVERLRSITSLLPLGSRIRKRFHVDYASVEHLMTCLNHLIEGAGNAHLMTTPLIETIAEHSAGNYRVMTTLANELLEEGIKRQVSQLDEKLYFDVFAPQGKPSTLR